MKNDIDTAQPVWTTCRRLRLATGALAATLVTATTLAATSVAAHASATSSSPVVTPIAHQPARKPGPTPTSSGYVAPVLLPTKDYIGSTENDVQRDLTLTVKTTSQVLAPFASDPSSLNGRILVTTPRGRAQMIAQVTSATESATAWTIVTKRVSAFAALKPGPYAIAPDFAHARFTPDSGVTMTPIAGSGSGGHTVSETYELGPYTKSYPCGTGGGVNLTADLRLTPWIDAGAQFGYFSLDSAHLIAGLDETATLSASTTAPADKAATCAKSVQLGTFTVPIDIGPVVADVAFTLKADLTASLKGTVKTSVTQSFSGEAGVQYDGNTWSTVDGADDHISFTKDINGSDKIEAGLTAEAKLSFYDIISAQLDLRAYAGMKLQQPPAPRFDLYAGASLKYEIDAAGFDVFDGTIWSTGDVSLFHTPVITTTALPLAHWGSGGVAPGAPPTYSTQLSADGGVGGLTYSVVGGSLPSGVTLSSHGLLSGTPRGSASTCAPPCTPAPTPDQTFTFTVQVTDSTGFTGSRQLGLTVGTVRVATSTLPAGMTGRSYAANLIATNIVGSPSWQIVSGRLPNQFTLSPTGRISGTPTAAGRSSFTVRVTDSTGQSATHAESITITCPSRCQ